jgi:hypothetical protein
VLALSYDQKIMRKTDQERVMLILKLIEFYEKTGWYISATIAEMH